MEGFLGFISRRGKEGLGQVNSKGLAKIRYLCYPKHMKRTNLVLDEDLLAKASRLLGEKTFSATVNKALEEAIKVTSLRNLLNFQGSDLWDGDLQEMREDKGYRKK